MVIQYWVLSRQLDDAEAMCTINFLADPSREVPSFWSGCPCDVTQTVILHWMQIDRPENCTARQLIEDLDDAIYASCARLILNQIRFYDTTEWDMPHTWLLLKKCGEWRSTMTISRGNKWIGTRLSGIIKNGSHRMDQTKWLNTGLTEIIKNSYLKRRHFGCGSLMIWTPFLAGFSKLCFIDESMNFSLYLDILYNY